MYDINWLSQQFLYPENEYRPVQIIHCYFPHEEDKIAPFIADALERGMGGFVVNVGGGVDTYLCDENEWIATKRFIEACLDSGLKIWLYDEQGYPSGAAGKLVIEKNPEFHVLGLVCQTIESAGGNGEAELDGGRIISAGAYPIIKRDEYGEILLSREKKQNVKISEGKVFWVLPHGDWMITVISEKKIEYKTMHDVYFVDLLREDVTESFLNFTHRRYLEHFGKDIMSKIEAVFTDEPSFACHGCSGHFIEKYAVSAWTGEVENLVDNLEKRAVDIFFDTDLDFRRTRREYWAAVSKLFSDNYFLPIYKFCENNGIKSTGHLYGEENLAMQTALNGYLFGLYRNMQMPGVDRLYCTDPHNVIPEKTASSAAHIYSHKKVMSESSSHFESSWWHSGYTVDDMVNSMYYQYVLGVNQTASYYDYRQECSERSYFEKCAGITSAFMTNGTHRAPLLCLIPGQGAWERFIPRPYKFWESVLLWDVEYKIPQPLRELELMYDGTLKKLLANQYDYDLADETAVSEAFVCNGNIFLGNETYESLVIFDAALTGELFGTIVRLAEQNIKIYIVCNDNNNENETEINTGKYMRISTGSLILSQKYGAVICRSDNLINNISSKINPGIKISPANEDIWYRCTLLDGCIVYMLYNKSVSAAQTEIKFFLDEKEYCGCNIYNPKNGEVQIYHDINKTSLSSALPLVIEGKTAVFAVFY